MPLPEAQAFFNKDKEVTVIEVFVDNPEKIDEFSAATRVNAAGRPLIITTGGKRNRDLFRRAQGREATSCSSS